MTLKKDTKIYVAGNRGLVGSAVCRRLQKGGYTDILTRPHAELDLIRQADVEDFFSKERPEVVILAAAKVGGIGANSTYPADFLYQNLAIGINIINAAYRSGVKKLINLGSSCIYPRLAPQPIKEEHLLAGPLEPTNEAYAVAKIAAVKLCRYYNEQYGCDFLSVMPANMYGPGDNYDLESSHVLPAMIRKFHEAKVSRGPVRLWGDGSPYREFLYSEDLADALVFIMEQYSAREVGELINVGTGMDLTLRELAVLIARVVGYHGEVAWDTSMPTGMPRKLLEVSRLKSLGWTARTGLEEGIRLAYSDFLKSYEEKSQRK